MELFYMITKEGYGSTRLIVNDILFRMTLNKFELQISHLFN